MYFPLKNVLSFQRMQQTNRMLVSMVVIFGSTWLPLNLINLVADLNLVELDCWKFYHALFILCHMTAMSSTCYNSFLYGRFNGAFGKEFVKVCPFLKRICGNQQYTDEHLGPIEVPLVTLGGNSVKGKSTTLKSGQCEGNNFSSAV